MNNAATIERSSNANAPITRVDTSSAAPKSRIERVLLTSGLVAALIGVVLLARIAITADPSVSLETAASSGQMSARLDYYEWLSHDHGKHSHDDEDGEEVAINNDVDLNPELQEGFARPASMMPGTPDEGFQRLQIELYMENSTGPATEVSPTDFWLEDDEGTWWPGLEGGTFRPTELNAGHALNTVLAFDVQDNMADADMELVWIWNGQETRFAVTGSDHH
jgi:hypothetical protein